MTDMRSVKKVATSPPPSLAVGAKDAAAMFSLSSRTWWRLASAGKTPPSFQLGKRRLWRVEDLERWSAWGFPSRCEFEKRLLDESKTKK